MRNLYSYNPPEVAFHIWISNYPFSGHPLDDRRFYSFVLTVHKYKRQGKRWRNKVFFSKKIREYGYLHSEDEIAKKYDQMVLILDYLESCITPVFRKRTFYLNEDNYYKTDYVARAVMDRKLITVDVSKEEYEKNRIKKSTFLRK